MIRYRGHIVYVVTATYPNVADVTACVRPAVYADLRQPFGLGVISNGRCIPLSPYEAKEVMRE